MSASKRETVDELWSRHETTIAQWESESRALPATMPLGDYIEWCETKRRELAAADARATEGMTVDEYFRWLELARAPWAAKRAGFDTSKLTSPAERTRLFEGIIAVAAADAAERGRADGIRRLGLTGTHKRMAH